MATAYDTWKTDAPYDAEGEWVAERALVLRERWMKDPKRVEGALTRAMEDGFPGLEKFLANFFCSLGVPTGRDVSSDAYHLQGTLLGAIRCRIESDAVIAAQSEWDNRQTGPEGGE
jgi:hypothetical protein